MLCTRMSWLGTMRFPLAPIRFHKETPMAAPQRGLTPDFAAALRDTNLQRLRQTKMEITPKKVLARCCPTPKRDYRPDPNARTAGELAYGILLPHRCSNA